jgi:catechol 2,3-dioxygenase
MTPTLELRSIALRVHDLPRAVAFYHALGFETTAQENDRAVLAAPGGGGRLELRSAANAGPAPRDAAGLFHAALLLPSRAALGRWLRHAVAAGVEFQGFSDHGVSEALYFADPDGNGLEFYADRPREAWPYRDGQLAMTTLPLDLDDLAAETNQNSAADFDVARPLAGARWGHLHLRVTDLERSTAWYREHLGLDVTQGNYPGARFLAADGYHHHLGLNTWGSPRRPAPPDALGLAEAIFTRTRAMEPASAPDPDGIAMRVEPADHGLSRTANSSAGRSA